MCQEKLADHRKTGEGKGVRAEPGGRGAGKLLGAAQGAAPGAEHHPNPAADSSAASLPRSETSKEKTNNCRGGRGRQGS